LTRWRDEFLQLIRLSGCAALLASPFPAREEMERQRNGVAMLACLPKGVRADTVATRPAFLDAWKAKKRCLVLSDGYPVRERCRWNSELLLSRRL
jgi:hypothetical protein